MRKFEFIKPQITVESSDLENYGKFIISPLERGYGITLGNALRRVLLSSMPGVAIVAMDVEGVAHEFMALNGVLEDVTEIILNLKSIILSIDDAFISSNKALILPASLPLAFPAAIFQLSGKMLCFVLNWQSLPSMVILAIIITSPFFFSEPFFK